MAAFVCSTGWEPRRRAGFRRLRRGPSGTGGRPGVPVQWVGKQCWQPGRPLGPRALEEDEREQNRPPERGNGAWWVGSPVPYVLKNISFGAHKLEAEAWLGWGEAFVFQSDGEQGDLSAPAACGMSITSPPATVTARAKAGVVAERELGLMLVVKSRRFPDFFFFYWHPFLSPVRGGELYRNSTPAEFAIYLRKPRLGYSRRQPGLCERCLTLPSYSAVPVSLSISVFLPFGRCCLRWTEGKAGTTWQNPILGL